MKLNKLSAAMASAIFISIPVWAGGGANGEYGESLEVNGGVETPLNSIGWMKWGSPGDTASPSGEDAETQPGKQLTFIKKEIQGYTGSAGEDAKDLGPVNIFLDDTMGGGGAGGAGGGTIVGGVAVGGAGGMSIASGALGGNGGAVRGNTIDVQETVIHGAAGGAGGQGKDGGGGAGGIGGGTILGGWSAGGASGNSTYFLYPNRSEELPRDFEFGNYDGNGGSGGQVSDNVVTVKDSILFGAQGGDGAGMSGANVGIGIGGMGGGSVIGGVSLGGAGGLGKPYERDALMAPDGLVKASASGGAGGEVSNNSIVIDNVTLHQAAGGGSGLSVPALAGGAVMGGVSIGGAGGLVTYQNTLDVTRPQARGGAGGDVSHNSIAVSGDSIIPGDIYGGYSLGGQAGAIIENGNLRSDDFGVGGKAGNNTVTLIGESIQIMGSLYGGLSINGDGEENKDEQYKNFYQGNTLNLQKYRGSVNGISNFEKYNWLLPLDSFDGDEIIAITGSEPVLLDNTMHSVDVEADGNVLHAGDQVILITKAKGNFTLNNYQVEQGFFILYDAKMDIENINGEGALVLTVLGEKDGIPDGKINPETEGLLKGRVAQLAFVDQGTDMMSDGIWSARASLRRSDANLFVVTEGGSNRYKIGGESHVKLKDIKFAVGGAKAFQLGGQSVGMLGAFVEHGNGNYDSETDLGTYGEVSGSGKLRYHGVGALFHMDVAGTDVSKVHHKPNIFDDKYGLYVHGVLRAGQVKVDFHSADMVNGYGVEARYHTKSRYVSAMAGAGYVWTLDAKQALDFYGRYTYSRLNAKDAQVIDETMHLGTAHSQRVRLGVRYGYAYSDKVVPYAGVAYERNFTGNVSGSAYGLSIKEKSLKGNTGLLEAGLMIKPAGANDALSLHMGVQAYMGQRRGQNATVKARYVF